MIVTSEMAARLADRMVGIVDANRKSFMESDDFENVFETCFDMLIAPKIPKWSIEKVYTQLEKSPEIQLAYTVIKGYIEDARIEAEYAADVATNPTKYYGSVHDYH